MMWGVEALHQWRCMMSKMQSVVRGFNQVFAYHLNRNLTLCPCCR
jgi:hypothetical protein